jgi:hypothetical protein
VKKTLLIPLLGTTMLAWLPLTVAREVVVLPGVVNPVGIASGVDTQGPGLLTVGAQDINTSNDPGGAITTNAANTASILFNNSSTVTGFVGAIGATFLNVSAGANANTVTFNGPVYSTTFSVAGTGTVNFYGGFTSNTGSTMDFAGNGFINVGAGQTVKAAITNSAGAGTGTLTLNANSILNGAVGAASGLKQINVVGGNALITGQANAAAYSLDTNTLNVAGAFKIPVAGTINTTIFSPSLYGKIVPVGAATIGNALQVNVTVTGPIPVGSIFNIVDATSGTNGSTVTATSNTHHERQGADHRDPDSAGDRRGPCSQSDGPGHRPGHRRPAVDAGNRTAIDGDHVAAERCRCCRCTGATPARCGQSRSATGELPHHPAVSGTVGRAHGKHPAAVCAE